EGREALCGDPSREIELRGGEDRRGIDDGAERLEVPVAALAHGDHEPDARTAAQRRAHALAGLDRDVVGDAIGEGVWDGNVEDEIRDAHYRVRRWSYSRFASLRSSHAMRRYSGPGLRSRNAGWNVGTSTAL